MLTGNLKEAADADDLLATLREGESPGIFFTCFVSTKVQIQTHLRRRFSVYLLNRTKVQILTRACGAQWWVYKGRCDQKIPLHLFYHWIPGTRNLCRLLVSGINCKDSAMGVLSDHKSCSAGSIPVSPNRHGINQRNIIPLKEFARQNFQIDAHDRE
jgi:hypothetical protein